MKKQENLLMKGKWLTGALVLAMAAVTLAGCGAKDETKEKVEQVTLNEVAHSIFYAPQYVAIEEGHNSRSRSY